jgi:hypothetical protein
MAPTTMKAYATGKKGLLSLFKSAITERSISHGVSVRDDWPVPKMEDNEVLVKVHSVALNVLLSAPMHNVNC